MVMGRPREHDRDKLAQELIEWARKSDSINLNKFCCTREPPLAPSKITIFAKECDNFRKAYETAKAFLAARREEMLNAETLHVKAYDLNATTYDYFLKEERRQNAEFEANLSKQVAEQVNENILKAYDAHREQLKDLRKTYSSDKNQASKSSKIDSKSE